MLKSPPPPNPPALNISVSHSPTLNTQSSPSSFTSESSHTSSNTNSSSASNHSNSSSSTINNNAPTSSVNEEDATVTDSIKTEPPSCIVTEPDTSTVQPTATGNGKNNKPLYY